MEIKFLKLEAAGNDFVGLDGRNASLPPPAQWQALVRALCDRHRGIGADGVLLLSSPENGSGQDFAMRYYNADGSEGEMCGNGARAMALFARDSGAAGPSMRFGTMAGEYTAEALPGAVRVDFPPVPDNPREAHVHVTLPFGGPVHFLTVGVPHAVLFVKDVAALDVERLGRALRHDEAFAPAGTNVNFAQATGPSELLVRTYERGVEAETLACGTGSVAASCCLLHREGRKGPATVTVRPTGGDTLRISAEPAAGGQGFGNIALEGPARIVFRGVYPWNSTG